MSTYELVSDGDEPKPVEVKWPKYKGYPRRLWQDVNRVAIVRAARPSFTPRECAQMQRTLAVLLGDMAEADPAPAPAQLSRRARVRRASRASLARHAPESGRRATSPPCEGGRRSSRRSRRS